MVPRFIQYSGEAFRAPWERPAGEVVGEDKIWTPCGPYPEIISARVEEEEPVAKENSKSKRVHCNIRSSMRSSHDLVLVGNAGLDSELEQLNVRAFLFF